MRNKYKDLLFIVIDKIEDIKKIDRDLTKHEVLELENLEVKKAIYYNHWKSFEL